MERRPEAAEAVTRKATAPTAESAASPGKHRLPVQGIGPRRPFTKLPFTKVLPALFGPGIIPFRLLTRNRFGVLYLLFPRRQAATPVRPPAARQPAFPPSPRPSGLQRQMLSGVQVMTTPTADTAGMCLLLTFESRRYLLGNLSEGTQRALTQRRVPLTKLSHIFLTGGVNWKNAGGLLGMVLTVADVLSHQSAEVARERKKRNKKAGEAAAPAVPVLGIRGGKNLTYMLASARTFIFRKGMPLDPVEVTADPRLTAGASSEPDWQDENIQVWNIALQRPPQPALSSPRKRSHDMMTDSEDDRADSKGLPGVTSRQGDSPESSQEILQSVVAHMFNSDWAIDALVETTLHQAKLPATLFVKDENNNLKKYDGPLPGGPVEVPDMPVLVRKPWPGAAVLELPAATPASDSVCYIVKGQPRRGRFKPEKAVEYGVAKQEFKLLTQGQAVKGKDGMEVTPEMVMDSTVPGRGFALVELPTSDFIAPFLARPEWSDEQVMSGIDAMYWNLGPGVASDPKVLDFMSKHSKMKHIVSSGDVSPNVIAMEGAAAKAIQHNQIDPDRFPLPSFDNNKPLHPVPAPESPRPYQVARTGATLQLSPKAVFKDDLAFPLMDTTAPLREVGADVLELAAAARAKLSDPAFLASIEETESDIPNRDTEIITLGTGSALPSKYRNVSATLVRVPGYGSYLFDCGENTLGQMQRLYGGEKTKEVLRDLKAIFISHPHADHHLGLPGVLRGWHLATQASAAHKGARLAVVSTRNIHSFLREYGSVETLGYSRVRRVELRGLGRAGIYSAVQFAGHEDDDFGLAKVEACRVEHCFGAVATVVTWPSGLRIAYSGDCRPSRLFAQLGRGATLLLHECTLDDELARDAVLKKHSTMSEALGVARDMGARRVVLTHFSQRYPKFPNLGSWGELQGDVRDHQAVLMAFDHMCVKLGDFKKAELFLPALKRLAEKDDPKAAD